MTVRSNPSSAHRPRGTEGHQMASGDTRRIRADFGDLGALFEETERHRTAREQRLPRVA